MLAANTIAGSPVGARRSKRSFSACCAVSFSIWVQPKGRPQQDLQSEIDRLAHEHGAPSFQPHVTLLPNIHSDEATVLQNAELLARRLEPYRINFEDLSCGSIFHQCVYLLCCQDTATLGAGQTAREVFGQEPSQPYMPHLSLLYSDMDQDSRLKVAADARQHLSDPPNTTLKIRGFDVDTISVWETDASDRSLRSWKLVKELRLHPA